MTLIGVLLNLGGDVPILAVRTRSKWEVFYQSHIEALASVESMEAGKIPVTNP